MSGGMPESESLSIFHDVLIVSLEQSVAGPLCSRLFADLGARVIKVERPGSGDFARTWGSAVGPWSSADLWVNPNKESMTLNLKHARGREVMARLLKRADVLIETFKPGVADRLNLSYEKLSPSHPRLVYAHISGYGQDGPYRDKRAMDSLIQGEAGLIALTGTEESPARSAASVADISAGLYAAFAISAALFHARQTGRGQEIDVSMLETTASLLGYWAFNYWYRDRPRRMGTHHPVMAPYGVYETSDGFVNICVSSDDVWGKFCAAIDHPELLEDELLSTNDLRLRNRERMDSKIKSAFRSKGLGEWIKTLDAAGVPCASVNELDEVLSHPQLQFRGLIQEMESAYGTVKMFNFPARLSDTPARLKSVPPELGQHTDAVLRELEYSDEEIAELRREGAV